MRFNVLAAFAALIVSLFILPDAAIGVGSIIPGKEVSITVPGHPEFSTRCLVASDGTIEYPLLAGVSITGLTPSEVRGLLLPLLMRYESEPEVFVIVSEEQIIKVQIYGAVVRPGKYEEDSPLNLQQLIAMAGGWTDKADLTEILIMNADHGSHVERSIDLIGLFQSDSIVITPYLIDGDMVVVPMLAPNTSVRVFGAVTSPGGVYISQNENLFDIIMRANGLLPSADGRRVRILTRDGRISSDSRFDVVQALESGRTEDLPLLKQGDIVIVPELKAWREYSFWIYWLRDIAILASSLVILRNSF